MGADDMNMDHDNGNTDQHSDPIEILYEDEFLVAINKRQVYSCIEAG